MTAMFPGSGVPPAEAINSLPDPDTVNCDELWYSTSRCQPRFDPAAANAMLAELINLINKAEVQYDCTKNNQVETAVRYLIQRGLPKGSALGGGGGVWVGTLDPAITRCNDYLTLSLVAPENNPGPVTIDLGLGPWPLLRNDGKPVAGGDLTGLVPFQVIMRNCTFYLTGMVKSQASPVFDLVVGIFDLDADWPVPLGVTSLQAEAWGGGGGGGAGNTALSLGGGGGGGGEYGMGYFPVVPGEIIMIRIGKGGLGSNVNGTPGNAGTPTTVFIPSLGQVMTMTGGGPGLTGGQQGSTGGQGGSVYGGGEVIPGGGGFIPNGTFAQSGSPGGGTPRGRLYAMQGNPGLPPGGGGSGNFVTSGYTPTDTMGANGRVKLVYPRTS